MALGEKMIWVRLLSLEEQMELSRKPVPDCRRAILMVLAFTAACRLGLGDPARKFYDDDPISKEPETQDASHVVPWKIDLFYDLTLNQFAHPGQPAGPRAQNINTIVEYQSIG